MNRNVIYYPYIRVPQNVWFTRVLLYWDQIFSIVPMEYVNNQSLLGEYMHGLIQEDLVIPIVPGEYIREIPKFTEAFLNYVDDSNYPVNRVSIRDKRMKTFDLFSEKLDTIGDELTNRGLARKSFGVYQVEAYTAKQFMAYLAGALGKIPEIQSKPITDKPQNLVSFSPYQGGRYYGIDRTRTIILNDILPAPKGYINPAELANFKEDHLPELNSFRNKIESFLPIAASIKGEPNRSKAISEFVIEIQDEINYLSGLMQSAGWKRINLVRFLAYSTVAFGVTEAATNSGLAGVIAAAFSGSGEIYNILRDKKSILEGKYAAYAVYARERFSDQ